MKLINLKKVSIFSLLLLLLSSQLLCFGDFNFSLNEPYQGEGLFVELPAKKGAALGFYAGIPLSVPCYLYHQATKSRFDLFSDLEAVVNTSFFCENLMGNVVGFPFYIVKKTLYDFPKNILNLKPNEDSIS